MAAVYPRPTRSPSLVLLAAAALGAPLLLPGCGRGDAALSAEGEARGLRERERPRVRVESVERREMVRVLETTTVVESEAEIELPARIPGVVVEVLAEEGDAVEAGAVLARLDVREQENAVRDAEIALQEAGEARERLAVARLEAVERQAQLTLAEEQRERDHERNLRLFEDEAVASNLSAVELEASALAWKDASAQRKQAELALERARLEEVAAQTAIEKAQLALDRAGLQLSYGEITARFAGVVAERSCRVGQDLAIGTPAFSLTDTGRLRAVFYRPQAELPLFSGGGALEITATAEAAPGDVFLGEVLRTSPTVDADSGNFRVTARMDVLPRGGEPGGPRLLPGMLVRLSIVTDRHPDALVVSKRSLRREGEDVYVLAVDAAGEAVRRVLVEEGYAGQDHVEVLPLEPGALGEGGLVVLVGSRDLEDGDDVAIEDEPATDAPAPGSG